MWSRIVFTAAALIGLLSFGTPALASVHAGDELFVTVYDHPELTGPFAVDSTNHISMPLIGGVDVRGLGTTQIAARIRSSLAQYVIHPGVNVQLKTQLPVLFVSGGPGGTLAYQPGETLVAALGTLVPRLQDPTKVTDANAAATQNGRFADLERSGLDLRHVGIIRDEKPIGTYDAEQLFAKGTGGPDLQAGDTLTFANKPNMVRVIGEVQKPGFAFLDADEPLSDALFQVGGLQSTASTARIRLQGPGTTQLVAQGDPRWNDPANGTTAITVPTAPRVNIAGLVDKPGPVSLKTDPTLLSALYEAGGPQKWANLHDVQVMQNGQKTSYDVTKLVHGDTSQNPMLHDGDTVFVPEGRKVDPNVFTQILNAALLFKVL